MSLGSKNYHTVTPTASPAAWDERFRSALHSLCEAATATLAPRGQKLGSRRYLQAAVPFLPSVFHAATDCPSPLQPRHESILFINNSLDAFHDRSHAPNLAVSALRCCGILPRLEHANSISFVRAATARVPFRCRDAHSARSWSGGSYRIAIYFLVRYFSFDPTAGDEGCEGVVHYCGIVASCAAPGRISWCWPSRAAATSPHSERQVAVAAVPHSQGGLP